MLFSCTVANPRDNFPPTPPGRYNGPRTYERVVDPSSRLYQNPYAQPPRRYYPYYDIDYYYVSPTGPGAYTTDPSQPKSNPVDNKY